MVDVHTSPDYAMAKAEEPVTHVVVLRKPPEESASPPSYFQFEQDPHSTQISVEGQPWVKR